MSAPSDCFVLRVPLLPLDILSGWAAAPAVPATPASPGFQSHLAAHVAHLRDSYRELLDDPIVREAIFVASPDLHGAIDAWLLDPAAPRARDVERALTRYLTRMATRPTPFGLFGSVSTGLVADTTSLAVAPHTAIRRHTRLDVDYLNQVIDALIADPAIQPWLRYRPADTVFKVAGSWRYIETRVKEKARTHHMVSIEDNPAVSAALARAAAGATPAELAAALRALGVDDAEGFAAALIDSRILQPDLECPVTGDAPASSIIRRLSAIPGTERLVAALTQAVHETRALDSGPVAAGAEAYRSIARTLEALPGKVEIARLFQVDTSRPGGATLGPEATALIRRSGDLLRDICSEPVSEELERVKRAFAERFEGREVPLLEALDADCGVGAALGSGARGSSTLLEGLAFPETTTPTVPWGDREACLLNLIVRAAERGTNEVELGEVDLKRLRPATLRPALRACAVHATLIQEPGQPPRVLVHSLTASPVARLVARFSHLDADLDATVRRLTVAEEALEPDALHAEIVHLPEGRAGNVILRPVLRDYEITVMGASGADASQQLRLSDLTVQLQDHTFVVRSARLGRRVVPHLTTAHNFAGWGVGPYRFLCLLQTDANRAGAWWSWGPLEVSPFVPRIRVGNVILSRAAWRISKAEIAGLRGADLAACYAAAQALRAARALPRWVVLADGDNELVIDLDNALAVDSLAQLLKARDEATLLEWYPAEAGAAAHGPAGRYAHQVVVPFIDAPEQPAAAADVSDMRSSAPRRDRTRVQRSWGPGSAWVFAKVYGGTATADRLLTDIVGPTSEHLLKKGAVDRWFFIRYADPDDHVRWRVQVPAGGSAATVRTQLERALASAVERELGWRIAFDTYDREIERYGGPRALLLAERWFHADSQAVVEVLRELDAKGSPDDRWLATILSIDRLLTDLGFDLATKAAAMRDARERFGAEFKVDAAFRRALGDRLRPVARTLDVLLSAGPERGSLLAAAAASFARRSRQSRRTLASLQRLAARGQLSRSVFDLSFSYVHMAVNRLIRSEARMHELVVYDFLAQTYTRQLARARKG